MIVNEFQKNLSHAANNIINYFNILNAPSVLAIAIAGESGCGKTSLGNALSKALNDKNIPTIVLHQDDYFILPPQKNHAARVANFTHIGPSEVRLSLLNEHLSIIKNKAENTLITPVMNWEKDIEEKKSIDIQDLKVVIIEGTYTSLLNNADIKIFINTPYTQTKQNRIARNREEVTDFIESVLEKESNIIKQHASLAHIQLDSDFKMVINQNILNE
ncbi:MAG: uridine kinase family protein [Chitinophagaceae bacterium]